MSNPMSRRRLLIGGAGFVSAAAMSSGWSPASASTVDQAQAVAPVVKPEQLPWPEARAIVAATKVPFFPPATFNVLDHGARNDGTTDNTAAFARAITTCNAAGGGSVIIPAGTYVTGAIHLMSNVNLRLDGATLMFSSDAGKYPIVFTRYESIECMNRSPMIYAYDATNIALTGIGVLDGKNVASWN